MRLPAWEIRRPDGTVLIRWVGDEVVFQWGDHRPGGRASVFRNDELVYELLDGLVVV